MSERADPSKYEWWCYECEKFVPSSEVCLAVHTGPNGCQGDCTPLPEAPSNKKDLRIRELEQQLDDIANYPDPDFPADDAAGEAKRAWRIIYALKGMAKLKEKKDA